MTINVLNKVQTITVQNQEVSFNKMVFSFGDTNNLSNDPLLVAVELSEKQGGFFDSGEKFEFFMDEKLVLTVQSLSSDSSGKIPSDWDIAQNAGCMRDNIIIGEDINISHYFNDNEFISSF